MSFIDSLEVSKPPVIESASRLAMLRVEYPGRVLDHGELIGGLELAKKFNADASPLKGNYLIMQFDDLARAVRDVPGLRAVFGTGYPFYALRDDMSVAHIAEIDRYIDTKILLAEQDRVKNIGGWICGACQTKNGLIDLKTECRPCDDVILKPREPFKAFPDLDVWLVVDKINDVVKSHVQSAVSFAGFRQSDVDITRSIRETIAVMRDIDSNLMPANRLPVDLHLITEKEFLKHIKNAPLHLGAGRLSADIAPVSLRVTWGKDDEPYNFLKDFLFSLTEHDSSDPFIKKALAESRKRVRDLGLLPTMVVSEMDPKESRQLQTKEIADILIRRFNRW